MEPQRTRTSFGGGGGDWFYLIVILNISITDAALAGSSSSGLAKRPTERDLSILQEETKERGCFASDTEKGKEDAPLLCLLEQVLCRQCLHI